MCYLLDFERGVQGGGVCSSGAGRGPQPSGRAQPPGRRKQCPVPLLPQVVGSIRWTVEVGQTLQKGDEVRQAAEFICFR